MEVRFRWLDFMGAHQRNISFIRARYKFNPTSSSWLWKWETSITAICADSLIVMINALIVHPFGKIKHFSLSMATLVSFPIQLFNENGYQIFITSIRIILCQSKFNMKYLQLLIRTPSKSIKKVLRKISMHLYANDIYYFIGLFVCQSLIGKVDKNIKNSG